MFVCHVRKLFEDCIVLVVSNRQMADRGQNWRLPSNSRKDQNLRSSRQTWIRQTSDRQGSHTTIPVFFVEDWMMFVGLVSHGFKTSSIVEGVSNRQTVDRG